MFTRNETRKVKVGNLVIGGGMPIRVQSMCQTKTRDIDSTIKQINELEKAGCEIIRLAVPDMESAKVLGEIKKQINIPLVADIHFQYLFALEAAKQGVDKIRINPGNIGGEDKVKAVVGACRQKNIPIRIGVNMGSLEKDLFTKYGQYGIARVMMESAARHITMLEKLDFTDIVVSLKGSDIKITEEAYLLFAKKYNYPLHLGITESGPLTSGIVKSSIGISSILKKGVGDTLRISTTGKPDDQVKIAWEILKTLRLRSKGVEIISCPTCGRTEINLIELATKVSQILSNIQAPIKVAVMGCVVNGPGEASFADIGICGGKKQGVIIEKGKIIKVVREEQALAAFVQEIKRILINKGFEDDAKKIICRY